MRASTIERTVEGTWIDGARWARRYRPGSPDEGAALHEVVHRLLEEERVAPGALDEEPLQREQLLVRCR